MAHLVQTVRSLWRVRQEVHADVYEGNVGPDWKPCLVQSARQPRVRNLNAVDLDADVLR
jgi:hypothetical protein